MLEPEFSSMLALGFRILTEGPQQVLICRSADGVLHQVSLLHIRQGEHQEEAALLRELEGMTVTHIIALWDDATLDLPSAYFRRELAAFCPDSQAALVLLQTGSGQLPLPLNAF